MVNALVRPVTVMSAVVLQGEGGSIANDIAGGGRGIIYMHIVVIVGEMGSCISFWENYP